MFWDLGGTFLVCLVIVIILVILVLVWSSGWPKHHLKQKQQWEIDRSSLVIGGKLGEGNFGVVYQGLWKTERPLNVAIKTYKGTMAQEEFLAEAEVMKNLEHKNIIRLYGVCTAEEPMYIVTEYMNKGSLQHYLLGEGRSLPQIKLVDIASQIASGMNYLSQCNYIHRDLAARNVLVDENLIVKISDFGLTRLIKENNIYNAHTGAALRWTAPEAVLRKLFSTKSDVWSFGIVLFELFTYGLIPYNGLHDNQVLDLVVLKGFHMPRPNGCPTGVYDIMLSCWQREANRRPTFCSLQKTLENLMKPDLRSCLASGTSMLTRALPNIGRHFSHF